MIPIWIAKFLWYLQPRFLLTNLRLRIPQTQFKKGMAYKVEEKIDLSEEFSLLNKLACRIRAGPKRNESGTAL
ncbi:hypothetical protein QRD38_17025 [Leptospira weilii]|uniref:hypothetical protein n=1 Tax=Leptospira weilii TaxID=28184 RepID=UPI00256F0E0F|nr:hypothetical protein [Leptospira weilii]MDL5247445.1 hypothetical protein [Leptospira weilii]